MEKTNDFHKDSTRKFYRIADANWGMYHNEDFTTLEKAKEAIEEHYTNSTNEYWKNRPQVILEITTITKVLK